MLMMKVTECSSGVRPPAAIQLFSLTSLLFLKRHAAPCWAGQSARGKTDGKTAADSLSSRNVFLALWGFVSTMTQMGNTDCRGDFHDNNMKRRDLKTRGDF